MADTIVFPGTVEWSGENPGISLKETADGPFVTLASFFRVVLSPHGRGHALVLLQSPQDANPPAERANFCLHDNEKMARYLIQDFVSHFGAWKGQAGLGNLQYRRRINRLGSYCKAEVKRAILSRNLIQIGRACHSSRYRGRVLRRYSIVTS